MLLQVQSLTAHFPPSIDKIPRIHLPLPPLSLPRPIIKRTHFSRLKSNPIHRFGIQSPKCSVSVVSDPTNLELTKNDKPFPAEVCRTLMELSSVGTLSTLDQEGWPLGIGVRFAVDSQGSPLLCLSNSNTTFVSNMRSTLHVQVFSCTFFPIFFGKDFNFGPLAH